MKKFLSLVLVALMMVMAFAGCSKPAPTDKPLEGTAAPEAGKLPVLGVCLYKYDDTYISNVRQALEKLAAGKAELLLNDGKGDQATQNDQIDLLIEKGVDVLLVNIVDIGAAQTVADKAKKADLPILFFNREPDTAVIKSYDKARFIGTTAKEAGVLQGQLAVTTWGDGSKYDVNKDGVMNYVMFQGEPNNPEAIARTEFAVKTIADAGIKVKELGLQVCDWDTAKAQTAMEAWLNKFGTEIEMVLANNDGMAQGAIAALNAIGYNTEKDAKGFVPVFGVDATAAACDLIARGMMSGSVVQDADAMAGCLFSLGMNVAAKKDHLDGTKYVYDETGVAIRIPYMAYKGK